MKTFTSLMEELAAHNTPDLDYSDQPEAAVLVQVDESTYKVVAGIEGQIDAGETISEENLEDLAEHVDFEIVEEADLTDEERLVLEAEEDEELPFDDEEGEEESLDESTVHLQPHGGKGLQFKVVKGIKGQLDVGEIIHDHHIDDLHDSGIKTKILGEAEYNPKSVDDAIASSNRRGRKIGGKEGKMIHALLKGRQRLPVGQRFDEQLDEGASRSFGSAIKKAEASRQRSIKAAKAAMKKGQSAESAARDHDIHIKHLQEDELNESTHPDVQRGYDAENKFGGMPGLVKHVTGKERHGHFFDKNADADKYQKAYPGVGIRRVKRGSKTVAFASHPNDETFSKSNIKEDEQIDELSKPMMARYIKKAGGTDIDSAGALMYQAGRLDAGAKYKDETEAGRSSYRKGVKRAQGVMKAAGKLAEDEQIDEIQHPADWDKSTKMEMGQRKRAGAAADRRKDKDGFGRIGKTVSEEQINELSTDLLKRYVNKSGRNISKLGGEKVAALYSTGKRVESPKGVALEKKQQARADSQYLAKRKIAGAGLKVTAT